MKIGGPAAIAAAAVVLLTGCGGGSDPTTSGTSEASPADAPPRAAYTNLNKAALTGALLGVEDLPPGYSQDADDGAESNVTFCDYKPPFKEKNYARRDFTKGAGLSSELLRVGLRQYASSDQARAAFNALTSALTTCRRQTVDGSQVIYAPMSVAKVGSGSIGVKITGDDVTVLQNYALVGPTVVATGGGGLVNANAEEISQLLEKQVTSYAEAAQK